MRTNKVKKQVEHNREPFGDVFAINADNLEAEALRQVELMSEYSEGLAEAEYELARLEEKKKTYRSEMIERVESGDENVPGRKTADTVEAHYRVDARYRSIVQQLLEAQYKRDRLQGAVYTLSHRKEMLDLLNRRHLAINNIQTSVEKIEQTRTIAHARVKERQNKEGKK